MKTVSACLYCDKKKNCPESVQAHNFLDSCFEAEDKAIRAAVKDLQSLSKIALKVDVLQKVNGVAELLVEQSGNMKQLAQKIITDGCASVCFHGGEPCRYEKEQNPKECFDCEEPCPCRDCWDGEKLKIDWSKLNET